MREDLSFLFDLFYDLWQQLKRLFQMSNAIHYLLGGVALYDRHFNQTRLSAF